MIEQTNGDHMKNMEEEIEKLSKKIDRLDKKIELIMEHFKIKPEELTSTPPMFISGITQFDM